MNKNKPSHTEIAAAIGMMLHFPQSIVLTFTETYNYLLYFIIYNILLILLITYLISTYIRKEEYGKALILGVVEVSIFFLTYFEFTLYQATP